MARQGNKSILLMIRILEGQRESCKSSYTKAKLNGMIGALNWVLQGGILK